MSNAPTPKLPYWPFLILNVFLAGLAMWLLSKILPPRDQSQVFLALGCLATGALAAWIGCQPFLRNFAAQVRGCENQQLKVAVDRIQQLETLGFQINEATSRWQTAQDSAAKTVLTASQMCDRMTTETRTFEEFMGNAQRTEIEHQKLEVDKLKRGEREWLQAAATIFDHLFALHGAAVQSGQSSVITQISQFQNACRESVRRVGLNPFIPAVGEPFDPRSQQTVQSEAAPTDEVPIKTILACGFTYQGQLIRHALVSCTEPSPATTEQTVETPSEITPEPEIEAEILFESDVGADPTPDASLQPNVTTPDSKTAQTDLPF
ncbi:MAG: nucleotide exchange factor GrpE [Verrucomicrobia bacterium]|nr:nucleotide exchange factor GrpE [Verrucomicrobiota bacterium]